MKQTLVIVRGAPATGKTTICERLRDTDKKVAWLSVDGVKPIFSNFDDRDVEISYKTTLVLLKYLLGEGYSVVFDGIFANLKPGDYLDQALEIAKDKNIPVKIYQLTASIETTLKRHRDRDWAKDKSEDYEQENVVRLHAKVRDNPIVGAIELNTEENSLDQCLEIIKKNFD